MLKQLIDDGFGKIEDYNCAEKIIYGANIVYDLGLSDDACKLLAGFGGGAGIGHLCGALAGCVAVLSSLYVENNAHESDRIAKLTRELLEEYKQKMSSIDCSALVDLYRKPDTKCDSVISAAAEVLDEIVEREGIQ